jgi:hypothetical protein
MATPASEWVGRAQHWQLMVRKAHEIDVQQPQKSPSERACLWGPLKVTPVTRSHWARWPAAFGTAHTQPRVVVVAARDVGGLQAQRLTASGRTCLASCGGLQTVFGLPASSVTQWA